MKIETAYQVANLVDQHRVAESEAKDWRKLRDRESYHDTDDDTRPMELKFLLHDSDADSLTFELQGQNEINHFLNLLVDLTNKRVENLKFEIERQDPAKVKYLRVLRFKYEDVVYQDVPNPARPEDLVLDDMPASVQELAEADEVWVSYKGQEFCIKGRAPQS